MDFVTNPIACLNLEGVDVEDKIIEEYLKFIKRLRKGYKDDYSHILDMICFLQIQESNNFIYQKLINERLQ